MSKAELKFYDKDGMSVSFIPNKLQIIYSNSHTGIEKRYGLIVTGNGISFRKELEIKE